MLFGLRTFIFYDYFLLFGENNLNFSCSERQLCLLYTAEMFSAKYCSNLPISSIFPEYPKKKNLPLPALLVFLFQEDHKGKSGRECKQHHRESDGHQQDDVPAGAAERGDCADLRYSWNLGMGGVMETPLLISVSLGRGAE